MVQRERVQNSHRAPTREKAPERGWCLPIGSIEGGSGHPELSWEDVRERELQEVPQARGSDLDVGVGN